MSLKKFAGLFLLAVGVILFLNGNLKFAKASVVRAVLEEGPQQVPDMNFLSIRVRVTEPVANGFEKGQVFVTLVRMENLSFKKGDVIELRNLGDLTVLGLYYKGVRLIATPTP